MCMDSFLRDRPMIAFNHSKSDFGPWIFMVSGDGKFLLHVSMNGFVLHHLAYVLSFSTVRESKSSPLCLPVLHLFPYFFITIDCLLHMYCSTYCTSNSKQFFLLCVYFCVLYYRWEGKFFRWSTPLSLWEYKQDPMWTSWTLRHFYTIEFNDIKHDCLDTFSYG